MQFYLTKLKVLILYEHYYIQNYRQENCMQTKLYSGLLQYKYSVTVAIDDNVNEEFIILLLIYLLLVGQYGS